MSILCFVPFILTAQSESSVQHFNTSNGLPQNTITGMAFDKAGYLWLGTNNGLIRYDGTNFKTFLSDPANTGTSGSNSALDISSIASDKKLLIRMRDGCVNTIENGKPLLYSDAIKNSSYYYELDGRFPSQAIFDKFNLPITSLIKNNKWNENIQAVLPINTTDFIVLGETDNRFLYYKGVTLQKEIDCTGNFRKFLKSGQHNLLLDDRLNIYLYDPVSSVFKQIAVDWAGPKKETDKCIFLWDKQTDESYCFYNSVFYILRFDAVRRVMKFVPKFVMKDEGHFWTNIVYDSLSATYFLSTLAEGLFQVQLKQIQTLSAKGKTGSDTIANDANHYALLKISDSSFLTTGGFEFTSIGIYKTTIKKLGNIYSNRETIARLGDTAILCVQRNQLFYYSKQDGFKQSRAFNESFNRQHRSFITLLQPEGDSVWVCSDAGIFSVKPNSARVILYGKPDARSLYFGPRLFFRLSDTQALFSNSSGLYVLKTAQPYTLDSFPEMKGMQVSSIVRYKHMFLLTVYKHGLFLLKDKNFYKVPVSEEQSELNFSHAAYIDRNENVWITTDKGLFRSSMPHVIAAVFKHGDMPFFFRYNEKDGILNTEFHGGGTPAYAVLANGKIFLTSEDGIITFNPEALQTDFRDGHIPIENIMVDDKKIDALITDSIYLKPGFKLLSIDFAVPHLDKSENLLLEYQLDNGDWKRIPVSPTQKMMLYHISPGYHQLLIRKRIGFGSRDFTYKKLTVYRQKYLYQQFWFYPALAAAFLLLVLLITQLRNNAINRHRRQLQIRVDEQTSELSKNVEAKELLVDIISEGMITPLKHVSSIARILGKNYKNDPRKMNAVLSDIKATSDNILADSIGIINYMKYNSSRVIINKRDVTLYDTISEAYGNFSLANQGKNITLINKAGIDVFVEIDDNIFAIILNTIITNAVKYSNANIIETFLEPIDEMRNEIVLVVKDNGYEAGARKLNEITELINGNLQAKSAISKTSNGLAYIIIGELIRIHNLSVSVGAAPDKGNMVSITLPAGISMYEDVNILIDDDD